MANDNSFGFVEAYGMVAAIEAADAMVKAARVKVKTVLNADVGMLSVICQGDLAACKAAVDAGKTAADRVGKCLSTNLIARPGEGLETLIGKQITSKITNEKKAPGTKAKTTRSGKSEGRAKK